jgi:hypothetical protein
MSATVEQVQEAVARTIAVRELVLASRTTEAVIHALAETARHWLAPDSPWRARAIDQAVDPTGFSPAMVNEIVDLIFSELTPGALGELLDRELGNRLVLDEFSLRGRLQTHATGPRLITHILAGNVPAPGIHSICCGLLLRSANLVKVSARDPVFPALFVESLREVDPNLADCVAVLNWPRTETAVTQAALAQAEAVIAYGDDRSVAALRQLTPPTAKFVGYGHKISFAVVAREAMTPEQLPALAQAAAFDISVYDQQGCLSPHVIYVEERGALGPRRFAAALAEAMTAYQQRVPRGALTVEAAAEFTTIRSGYQFRAESDRRVAVWTSLPANDWLVLYDDDPSFAPSCLNRVVYVKPTDGFSRVLGNVRRYAPLISTVGVAPMNERVMTFAGDLSQMGVSRVCPLGEMQRPPLAWHHDGRPNLAELVRWTDVG